MNNAGNRSGRQSLQKENRKAEEDETRRQEKE